MDQLVFCFLARLLLGVEFEVWRLLLESLEQEGRTKTLHDSCFQRG